MMTQALAWQPIEAAPKDGTWILATDGQNIATSQWLVSLAAEYSVAEDVFWVSYDRRLGVPTHWMPLPPLIGMLHAQDQGIAVACNGESRLMSTPFTPEQETRLREIAREEAIKAVVAASRAQASQACGYIIDQVRVDASAVEAFLDGSLGGCAA